jgi:hypothetical protein
MMQRRILERLAAGEIGIEEAEAELAFSAVSAVEEFARLDPGRHGRKGVPEIVYAQGKSAEQLKMITAQLLEGSGRAMISGLSEADWQQLADSFPGKDTAGDGRSGVLVLAETNGKPPAAGGKVGILTAGTADIPVAEQARLMAEEMGCSVLTAYDVGVAGVHRLAGPLGDMVKADVRCIVVAAGMEGALPSVVAGLVRAPVIGLPTSTGYGLGGKGVTALLAMLQSCCPGLAVVNIDNGIGAGAMAALIANAACSD